MTLEINRCAKIDRASDQPAHPNTKRSTDHTHRPGFGKEQFLNVTVARAQCFHHADLTTPLQHRHANFVLARLGEFRKPFVDAMRSRGILVRDRNSDPGCEGCVRITVGTNEQTDRLLRELRSGLESIGWRKPTEVSQ